MSRSSERGTAANSSSSRSSSSLASKPQRSPSMTLRSGASILPSAHASTISDLTMLFSAGVMHPKDSRFFVEAVAPDVAREGFAFFTPRVLALPRGPRDGHAGRAGIARVRSLGISPADRNPRGPSWRASVPVSGDLSGQSRLWRQHASSALHLPTLRAGAVLGNIDHRGQLRRGARGSRGPKCGTLEARAPDRHRRDGGGVRSHGPGRAARRAQAASPGDGAAPRRPGALSARRQRAQPDRSPRPRQGRAVWSARAERSLLGDGALGGRVARRPHRSGRGAAPGGAALLYG